MNEVTHAAAMRAQHEANRKAVLWLTGMDEEGLMDFMIDTGTAWMRQNANMDTHALLDVIQEPLIWKWWKNEWAIRDSMLFLNALYNVPANERLYAYRNMHQQVFLPGTFYHDDLLKGIYYVGEQLKREGEL